VTVFARELLCECIEEMQPLLAQHHREIMLEHYALDPRWEDYALLERMQRYALFTARDRGALVGYAGFYVDRHMHSLQFVHARNDVFYIVPSKRATPMALGFLRYCRRQLKAQGARYIGFECSQRNLLAPILQAIGFQPEGQSLGMHL
jgi:hypothetical protein